MSVLVMPYAMEAYFGCRRWACRHHRVHRGPQADRAWNGERVLLRRGARARGRTRPCAHAPNRRLRRLVRRGPVDPGPRTPSARSGRCGPSADGAGSVEALKRFEPTPAFIIGSGTASTATRTGPLVEPLTPGRGRGGEPADATALGADLACFDASRILPPARDLESQAAAADARRDTAPSTATSASTRQRSFAPSLRSAPSGSSDGGAHNQGGQGEATRPRNRSRGLRHRLGRAATWSQSQGLVPVHEDRTPSLHVSRHRERGWCCFSCGPWRNDLRLAAGMWGMNPRGREFIELRERLQNRFAGEIVRPRMAYGLERVMAKLLPPSRSPRDST